MRLLQRLLPFKDESIRGYIIRLSEENDYDTSKRLFRQVKLQKYNKFENLLVPQRKIDLSILSHLSGRPQNQLNSLMLFDDVDILNHIDDGLYHEVWRHGACTHQQRICPLCLCKKGYHKNCWELTVMTVCPDHNCVLIDNCQGCRKRIDPYRDKLFYCNCGFDFRKSKVFQGQSNLSKFIDSIYNNNSKEIIIDNNINCMNRFEFVYTLLILVRLVNGISSTKRSNLSAPLIKNSGIIDNLDKAFSIFDDWPKTFYLFLDELRKKESSPISFANLNSFFAKHFCTERLSFMSEAFKFYLQHYWKEGYEQTLSITETEYKKIYSKITAVAIRGGETVQVDGLLSKEVSLMLGLGLDQVPVLRDRGILQPVSGPNIDGSPVWKYSNVDCERILTGFELANIKDTSSAQSLSFYKTVSNFAMYDLTLADLVDAVLKGFISPINKAGEGKLNEYSFDKNQIVNYLKQGYLTIEEISKDLKVKRGAAERWVKQGYIKYSKSLRSGAFKLISVQDYREFRDHYIPAVEVVRNHPRINSTEKLLRVLGGFGITPCNQRVLGSDWYILENSNRLKEVLSII